MKHVAHVLTEERLREIVQEEVFLYLVQEGLWDDVKDGALKLKSAVTKQFGKAAQKWLESIKSVGQKLGTLPDEVKQVIEALKVGMKESGESIHLDDNLKLAKEVGQLSKEKAMALVQADLEGPVHDLAASAQRAKSESRVYAAYAVLLEQAPPRLDEVGVVSGLGLGLAVLGGLPMIFSGLRKLATVLRAQRIASVMEKAEKVTHAFEVKTIEKVIPDKLAYAAYKFLHGRGLKFAKEKTDELSFEEFRSNADGSQSMQHVKGLIYKAVLVYFMFNGLAGVLNAGASLLGFVESTATAIKGVEIARGAMQIAALASKTI